MKKYQFSLFSMSSNLSFSAKETLENVEFSRASFCVYPNRTPTDIQRLSIYRCMISAQFRIIVSCHLGFREIRIIFRL